MAKQQHGGHTPIKGWGVPVVKPMYNKKQDKQRANAVYAELTPQAQKAQKAQSDANAKKYKDEADKKMFIKKEIKKVSPEVQFNPNKRKPFNIRG